MWCSDAAAGAAPAAGPAPAGSDAPAASATMFGRRRTLRRFAAGRATRPACPPTDSLMPPVSSGPSVTAGRERGSSHRQKGSVEPHVPDGYANEPPAHGLVLDAFAARTSERVWTLSTASLLAAVDAGRSPGELAAFLAERTAHAVPAAAHTRLDDVEARAERVRDPGLHRADDAAIGRTAEARRRRMRSAGMRPRSLTWTPCSRARVSAGDACDTGRPGGCADAVALRRRHRADAEPPQPERRRPRHVEAGHRSCGRGARQSACRTTRWSAMSRAAHARAPAHAVSDP